MNQVQAEQSQKLLHQFQQKMEEEMLMRQNMMHNQFQMMTKLQSDFPTFSASTIFDLKNRKENISTFYSTKWVRSMIFIEWIKWTLSSDLTYFTLVSVIHENNEICYKKVTLKVSIVQHNYRLVQKW